MNDSVKYLDKNTARLITSNQVIQGPYNVVKELVENALDAGASAIDVRLENYGLDKITVKDNAKGIGAADVAVMCQPGYSSKIKDFSDLENLRTYGFRGEALASICCVADVSITTKTEDDAVATTYKFNADGEIVDKSPSHLNQGTLICVQNIYHHQPARRRLLLNAKASANTQGFSKSSTISKIKSFLGALGVAWPFVRIFFVHGGSLVWKKQSVPIAAGEPIKTALGELLGHNLVTNMKVVKSELDDWGTMTAVLPTKISVVNETCQSSKSALILIINKRVVRHKKIEDILMDTFRVRFPTIGRNRYPACVLDLKVNQDDLDVNLEPDKSKVLLRSEKEDNLLEAIQTMLDRFYESEAPPGSDEVVEPPAHKRLKTSDGESSSQDPLSSLESLPSDSPQRLVPKDSSQSSSIIDTSQEEIIESSQIVPEDHGFKIEFFNPETVKESVPSSVLQSSAQSLVGDLNVDNVPEVCSKDTIPMQPSVVNLSEPSSEDEMETTLVENSLLLTPNLNQNNGIEDFVLTEEDEAALMELEKLVCLPDIQYNSSEGDVEVPKGVNTSPEINQADWSRGHIPSESGASIEGCQVLVQPKIATRHPKPMLQNDQRLSLTASPCTQMGLNNLRAFNMFCKETRPKLLKERPNMGLCEVAPLLARTWKDLPDEEKQRFDDVAEQYKLGKMKNNTSVLSNSSSASTTKQMKKKKEAQEKSEEASLCLSMLKSAAGKQIPTEEKEQQTRPVVTETAPQIEIISKENLEAPNEKENSQKSPTKKKKKNMKVVEVSINLEDAIKKKFIRQDLKVSANRVLGEWNGNWLVKQGLEFVIFNPWLMQEALSQSNKSSLAELGTHSCEISKENLKAVRNKAEFTTLLDSFSMQCSLDAKCLHGKFCRTVIYSGSLPSSQLSQSISKNEV